VGLNLLYHGNTVDGNIRPLPPPKKTVPPMSWVPCPAMATNFFRKVKHASYAATRDALAQECQKFKPDLKTAPKNGGGGGFL